VNESLLEIDDLRLGFPTADGVRPVVKGVSFDLKEGEILGVVGESGSGKSLTMASCIQLLPKGCLVAGGDVRYQGNSVLHGAEDEVQSLRGSEIALVLQDPMSSLHPTMKIGRQIINAVRAHNPDISKRHALERSAEALARVGMSDPARRMEAYPHELSGGLRQRAMIAMAIVNQPRVLLADEPTTALDVTLQRQILRLLTELNHDTGLSVLLVTHNFGVVAEACDRAVVMRDGEVVEAGATSELFSRPRERYTQDLLKAVPTIQDPPLSPAAPAPAEGGPLLECKGVTKLFTKRGLVRKHVVRAAVVDASIDVFPGEIVGLVGESGAGKTTLARSIAMLTKLSDGEILFEGQDISRRARDRGDTRRRIQMIFQDPYSSLNPRQTVEEIVREPLALHRLVKSDAEADARIDELLDLVRLKKSLRRRVPSQLSGGECQRVGIARAIACEPTLLVADEPLSALDVSIQAGILQLFADLRERLDLTIVLVTHDLGVVRRLCDRVAVMQDGVVVEVAAADRLFSAPQHEYTAKLIAAVPSVPRPGAGDGAAITSLATESEASPEGTGGVA
jgi:peptide/nickel transport system ATP-binding protein